MAKVKLPPINIPDAKIIFKNFEGRKTKFTPPGRRQFNLVLPVEDAKRMEAEGWNIKWPKPSDDGSALLPHTNILVQYDSPWPPQIYLKSGPKGKPKLLAEDNLVLLDSADIQRIDLVINPSHWEVNGDTGIKGYLKKAYITVNVDPFEEEYMAEDSQTPLGDAED